MKIENNYAVNSYELDNYRRYDKSVEEEIDKLAEVYTKGYERGFELTGKDLSKK